MQLSTGEVEVKFEKDPGRWAATPKFRYKLHLELEEKLAGLARHAATAPRRLNPEVSSAKAVVAAGVAAAHAKDILRELGLWRKIPFYQVLQPFPLHVDFIDHLLGAYDEILVLEETTGVIEMQLADRHKVRGKWSGAVPRVGELSARKDRGHRRRVRGCQNHAGQPAERPRPATDPVRRVSPPGELFCHQESRAQGDLHERHRLLHPRAEPGRGGHRAVHGGDHHPGRRVLPRLQEREEAARHRLHHRGFDLFPRRGPGPDRCRGPEGQVRAGDPGQPHHGHDRQPADPAKRVGGLRGVARHGEHRKRRSGLRGQVPAGGQPLRRSRSSPR